MTDLIRSWTALPRAARSAGLAGLPLTGELPCYHVYEVADGFLSVAALEREFWTEFCHAVHRDDLIARQFDGSAIAEIEAVLAPRSRDDWMSEFAGRDVCVEPALSLDESE